MQLQAQTLHIPTQAAGNADEWYLAWGFPGIWRLKKILFAPATGVAAAGTDFLTVGVAQNDGAGGAFGSTFATFNTDAGQTSLVVGTTIDMTISNFLLAEVQQARQYRVSKTVTGAGKILDGTFTFLCEKIN